MYDVLNRLIDKIVNPIMLLLFAAAGLVFIWGVYSLYIAKGGEEDRKLGSKHIMYGLIGMAIMIGAFSIIRFGLNTLNVFLGSNIAPPQTLR